MDDGTHQLSESIVFVADYYLLGKLYPAKVESYLRWVSHISGRKVQELTTEQFAQEYQLPVKIESALIANLDRFIS